MRDEELNSIELDLLEEIEKIPEEPEDFEIKKIKN